MKRLTMLIGLAMIAGTAFAFQSTYTIVSKTENGVETPYQGTISVAGDKNGLGMVEYKSVTIYVNELLNYEWLIRRKSLLNETTVEMISSNGEILTMSQQNDSVSVFGLPIFVGNKQGKVMYKTIRQVNNQPEDTETAKAQGLMAGAFGSGGAGSGSVNGAKWSVAGRDVVSLPKPSNNFNQEGTVVVQITVDAFGKVTSTKVTGGTVSDASTRKLAEEAAKKAVFSKGKNNVQGAITYTFKFS